MLFRSDGIDEVSPTGYTKVSECHADSVHTFYVHPSDFGMTKCAPADLVGGDTQTNAAMVRAVLDGERGPRRDAVLLNAAVGLFIAGRATTIREGLAAAGTAIDTGAARACLARLVEVSNQEAVQ